MRKETTTTYEVTVTHRGPAKTFWKLFNGKSSTILHTTAEETRTNTKLLPSVPRFNKDQKTVRLFIKQALEDAGLTYTKNYNLSADKGPIQYNDAGSSKFLKPWYNIDYQYHRAKIDNITEIVVRLEGIKIYFLWKEGLNNNGVVEILKYPDKPNSSGERIFGLAGTSHLMPGEFDINITDSINPSLYNSPRWSAKSKINLADPNIKDNLIIMFKTLGVRYFK